MEWAIYIVTLAICFSYVLLALISIVANVLSLLYGIDMVCFMELQIFLPFILHHGGNAEVSKEVVVLKEMKKLL